MAKVLFAEEDTELLSTHHLQRKQKFTNEDVVVVIRHHLFSYWSHSEISFTCPTPTIIYKISARCTPMDSKLLPSTTKAPGHWSMIAIPTIDNHSILVPYLSKFSVNPDLANLSE